MFIKEIDIQEKMDCEPIKRNKLKFELLHSEWFTEIPDDLEDNWLVKICPQGFRILLVAQNHITICYDKQGNIIFRLRSNFPGGRSQSNGITILDYYLPAQRPLIQDAMFKVLPVKTDTLPTILPYDGVVFYHKESHYTFGYTPLVGWLASYMLPEKLHIDVCLQNMVKKPKNYICMEAYLEERDHKKKKRSNAKHQTEVEAEMEIQ
ncbi:hypothetical protein NQ314_017081 [Rhamnusium bicolor]|uniref:Snurportin-1 n=1 Tax=Rhamnusium bicolor TaxID=1586634 RepID=A0AAV8WUJ0_9CUCU|nr:hypothetical protein NQ314_017081 [Rhamnusium bicolor]